MQLKPKHMHGDQRQIMWSQSLALLIVRIDDYCLMQVQLSATAMRQACWRGSGAAEVYQPR